MKVTITVETDARTVSRTDVYGEHRVVEYAVQQTIERFAVTNGIAVRAEVTDGAPRRATVADLTRDVTST